MLVYIILLLFFIYLKAELETRLVYEVDMSYNTYKWTNFLISFIEFISIGLILSSISEVRKLGELVWEKNAEFVAVVERINKKFLEIRSLIIKVIVLKVRLKFQPLKTIPVKIKLKSKDRKIAKLEKEILKRKKEIEKRKREIEKETQ